jgi:hypothetical protein
MTSNLLFVKIPARSLRSGVWHPGAVGLMSEPCHSRNFAGGVHRSFAPSLNSGLYDLLVLTYQNTVEIWPLCRLTRMHRHFKQHSARLSAQAQRGPFHSRRAWSTPTIPDANDSFRLDLRNYPEPGDEPLSDTQVLLRYLEPGFIARRLPPRVLLVGMTYLVSRLQVDLERGYRVIERSCLGSNISQGIS